MGFDCKSCWSLFERQVILLKLNTNKKHMPQFNFDKSNQNFFYEK